MRHLCFGVVLGLSVLATGSMTDAQTPTFPSSSSPRTHLRGCSFSRPPGDGWSVEPQSKVVGRITYFRSPTQDHFVRAGVVARRLVGVRNLDDLLASVRRARQDPAAIGPDNRVVSFEATPDSMLGAPCVRYHCQYLQEKTRRSKDLALINSTWGVLMLHPGASRCAGTADEMPFWVDIDYMDFRYVPKKQAEALASEARPLDAAGEAFFKSLQLLERDNRLQPLGPMGEPQSVAIGHGSVWVTDLGTNEMVRIDPADGKIIARIRVGRVPVGVAISDDAVWVSNKEDATVSRIDPSTNQVVATVKVGKHPMLLAAGSGSVWVANSQDGTVSRIDPGTNRTEGKPIKVGDESAGILSHDGVIWVTDHARNTLLRIDPQTNQTVGGPIPVGDGPNYITFGAGSLWVNCHSGESTDIWRIDPSNGAVIARIPTSGFPSSVAFGHDAVWVCDFREGSVRRINPATNQMEGQPIYAGFQLVDIRAADDALWVTDQVGCRVIRIPYETALTY